MTTEKQPPNSQRKYAMKTIIALSVLISLPAAASSFWQDSENVRDHRGSNESSSDQSDGAVDVAVDTLIDPVRDALEPVVESVGDALDGLGGSLSGSSDSADERDTIVDHRRGRSAPSQRQNETVPSRRAALSAPSGLALGFDGPTSLIVYWQDNATFEEGVHVERSIPVSARGGIQHDWVRIFSSEERVENRVRGTGSRSDIDHGLARRTLSADDRHPSIRKPYARKCAKIV